MMTVLKERKTRPSIRKISFRFNCFARQADLTILGEMFDYTPGSKRLMDTPKPGTINSSHPHLFTRQFNRWTDSKAVRSRSSTFGISPRQAQPAVNRKFYFDMHEMFFLADTMGRFYPPFPVRWKEEGRLMRITCE
jgi:hypothetical protein